MRYFLLSFFFWVAVCFVATAQLPEGFIREMIVTGLNPTSMVQSPEGRIFITEKNGSIRVISAGILLDEPLISLEVDDSNERGLGHIALHPDFDINGYFYVYYTVPGESFNRISRFTSLGNKALPESEKILLDLDKMHASIHNGGAMVFGFDNNLYISTGDGGGSWLAEDIKSTAAKVLRMNDQGKPVADNPSYHVNEGRAKYVYATGLRNPFTMTLHPLTGEIFANDVGGNKFEEVNRIIKGGFYGWPRVEGKQTGQDLPSEYVDPVFQYSHTNNFCSIVGSVFYYPAIAQFPENYIGKYFYSDYCKGHIRMLDVVTGEDKGVFLSDGDRVIDLMIGVDGSLYYLERKGLGDGSPEDNTGTNQGTLWKVSYTGSGAPFISTQPQTRLVSVGENAEFNIKASGSPELRYRWFVNGIEQLSQDSDSLLIENISISFDSSVIHGIVVNHLGEVSSDTVLLRVTTNHRPEATILTPDEDGIYTAGNSIQFSGTANDFEDGELEASSFSWKIDFHHGTHTHPGMPWSSGFKSGEWLISAAGETASDVWYRIYLKVVDSYGLTRIVYRDILPAVGKINVSSSPKELNINLDGASIPTPFEVEGVRGIKRFLSAPLKQAKADSIYFFNKWNDGSRSLTKEVTTMLADQHIEGIFDGHALGKGRGLTGSYYNNPNLEGEPVLVRVDSIIDFRFFAQSPDVTLPSDYFSIQWEGYIQAYRSGMYTFNVTADDGIIIEIDGHAIIDQWKPGVYYLSATKFLEEGRLYPIRIKMFDETWFSEIRLKWSSADFDPEIIPYTQFYPKDFLSRKNISGVIKVKTLTSDHLELLTESFKDVQMDFLITSVTGQTIVFPDQNIPIGLNTITINISRLSPGIYFLSGRDPKSRKRTIMKFVKFL